MSYDVIVVGLRAMGSATAYQAARHGARAPLDAPVCMYTNTPDLNSCSISAPPTHG